MENIDLYWGVRYLSGTSKDDLIEYIREMYVL